MNRIPSTKCLFCFVVFVVLFVFQAVVPSLCSQCDQDHLFSFGYNDKGQLGDGTNTNSNIPVAVSTSGVLSGKTITAISACEEFSLVLSSTGEVFSFGSNGNGQLGDGTDTNSNIPVAVSTSGVLNGKTITDIAAGGFYSLVLSSTGQVFSFGSNGYGELGDGTTTSSNIPVAVVTSGVLNGKTITAIAAGYWHSLVLSSSGQVFSFGYNEFGQLGNGTTTNKNTPVAVSTSGGLNGKTITAIAAGQDHSLVLTSTGQVFSFGDNRVGQLGDGTNTPRNTPVAVDISGLNGKTITAIASGSFHSLVLTSTGEVFSFGDNDWGQLGDKTTTDKWTPVAVDTTGVLNGTTITAIAAGKFHSLVLSSTGQVFSFGYNEFGQIGDGTNTYSNTPIAVSTSGVLNGKTITAIAAGGFHSLVVGVSLGNVTFDSPLPYLFVGQSNVAISWCGPGNVTIELIRDGSALIEGIASNWEGGSPFIWRNVSASDAPRSDFRFRIKSTTYPSVSPTTSNPFEIDTAEKRIQATTPSYGLEYLINSTNVEVSWTSQGHVGEFIKIEICKGESCITITPNISINSSPHTWQVKGFEGYSLEYFVRITSLEFPFVVGESSQFEIDTVEKKIYSVNTPLSYLFVEQSNVPIKWTSSGHLGNITIELIRDESATIDEIVSNWEGGSPFTWTNVSAPDAPRSDFRFQIKSSTYPSVSPTTSNPFEIDTAEKKIDSVNTPPSYLIVGQSNVAIIWAASGHLGNITIELIRDGDSAKIDEIVSNWGEGSPFIWTSVSASDAPRSDFRLKVKPATYSSVSPTKSNPFEIDTAEKRIDSVSTPSYLIVGQSNVAISWTSSGHLGNITIELIRDGDNAKIDEIVSNWEGGSSFIWTNVSASDAPRSDFRFQIKSTTYPSVPPTTSNPFEIAIPPILSSSSASSHHLSSSKIGDSSSTPEQSTESTSPNGGDNGGADPLLFGTVVILPIMFFVILIGVVIMAIVIILLTIKRRQSLKVNRQLLVQTLNRSASSKVNFEYNALEIKMSELAILERLGKGSFGMVYKASYRKSNVAVKMLEIDSEGMEEFLKEAITMAQLQHPRLLQFVGVVNDEGKFGIVTEFMDRGSLDKLLWRKNAGRLSWSVKMTILGDVASGMVFIHSRGFIHRDLKSPNILIGESNRAKIGDFGMTRVVDKSSSTMTEKQGTPLWMAPEVIESTGHYDNKCDVFSFGIIMWEVMNEKEPYHDIQNKQGVMFNVVRDPKFRPTLPSVETVMKIHSTEEERKSIDTNFESFVSLMQECWSHEPSSRPTFEQVVERLQEMCKPFS